MNSETNGPATGLAKWTAIVAVAMLAGAGGVAVRAADSIITVKGEVYSEPCSVSGTSGNITIDLGKVSAKALQTAGSSSPNWSAVSKIALTNCPAGTRTVTARFDGTADPDQADTFKSTGTAKNVSVWLVADPGNETIVAAGTRTATVSGGAAEFPIKAKLWSRNGAVTAGTVLSTISVTLSYQ